jgi:hypothetical protein
LLAAAAAAAEAGETGEEAEAAASFDLSFDLDCFVDDVPEAATAVAGEEVEGTRKAEAGGTEGWSKRISRSMRVSNTSNLPSASPATN